MQHSRGKSALVFCSTRKGAQEAALRLSQTAMTFGLSNPFIKSQEQQERLKEASLSFSDKQMQSCILFGVGYHNGGLSLKDRSLIEGLFLRGDVQILCTTNTLAHGINLPAHTVVIKSTQHFNKEKGLYMEYDRSMVLQMCGRAGRPPFDDTGMVVIMTRKETVHLYENLLSGCEMVESQLLTCMTEHLAAEIVQLTVCDIPRAIEWMKCSYLYVRMKKNPENYGLKKRIPGECLEKHMQEICVQKVNELSKHGMIWTDEYGFLLKPLEPGRLMTKYYLKFDTMKNIMSASENCSLEDALHVVCRSEEISWIQLRRNEKKILNDINSDKEGRLRFHILTENGKKKKRIQSKEEKIFVLANDCLTGDPLCHDLSLNQDVTSICSNGCRITKCMKEYFIYRKNYKGTLNSTLLAKCLHQKLWDDSPYLLKQLSGIGTVTAKALNSAGINSFKTLAEAEPRRIEIVTGRKYPFGNHIKETLLSLPPKVEMSIEEMENQRQGKSKLLITLTRLTQSNSTTKRHFADMVVGSEEDNLILFHEKIRVDEFPSPYSASVLVSNPHQGKLTVKADLIFEEYIGLDIHEKHIMVAKMESNVMHRRGNKKPTSTHDLPNEIFSIEDENDDVENTISHTPMEEVPVSSKSKDSSMPTFNLLDEVMDEGVSVVETEEKGNVNITELTIFDYIRRKINDFPVNATSNIANSSTSEVLTLTRKHNFWNQQEPQAAIEVLEIPDRSIKRKTIIIPDMVPEDSNLKHNISDFDLLGEQMNKGGNDWEIEDKTSEKVTEEMVFDHIRKKAKNFPLPTETMKLQLSTPSSKSFYKDQFESSSSVEVPDETASKKIRRETTKRTREKPDYGMDKTTDLMETETEMSVSDVPSLTDDTQLLHTQFKCPVDNQQRYSNGPSKTCSSDTKTENNKTLSFMGFKSVFSFL